MGVYIAHLTRTGQISLATAVKSDSGGRGYASFYAVIHFYFGADLTLVISVQAIFT